MEDRSAGSGTLLIDTNLLLVLLIGALDPAQIERFKRTSGYTRKDFELLRAFIGRYTRLLTTPNILTEVSNLVGQLSGPLKQRAFMTLKNLTDRTIEEQYWPAAELTQIPSFPVLGLADVSVIAAAESGVTVLTADFPLYNRLTSAGLLAINYTHLRMQAWT